MSSITESASQLDNVTPTVTVDQQAAVITGEVLVAQPKGAGTPTIGVPLLTVPHGTWTLVWVLRVLTDGVKAHFAQPGIVLPKALPPMTSILAMPTGTEVRWRVQLTNEVQAETSFSYEIVIKSSTLTIKKQAQIDFRRNHDRHDPIPVHDPVDPPKPNP